MGFAAAAPWAVPLIIGGIQAIAGSQGSKKAAKGAKPDIPSIFKPAVGAAMGPIYQRLAGRTPQFGGPFTSGLGTLEGGGLEGYNAALRNILGLAQGGLNEDVLSRAESTTRPLADIQRGDLLAGVREGAAARGGLFSSGALNTEADAMNRFEAQRRSDLLGNALSFGTQSLSAFDAIRNLLGSQYQEYLRVQPETGVSLLASLMGGTPFYTPPVPTNVYQQVGGAAGSLLGSPGFWQFLQQSQQPKTQ